MPKDLWGAIEADRQNKLIEAAKREPSPLEQALAEQGRSLREHRLGDAA